MCNPITRTSLGTQDHSLPFAHVHLSKSVSSFSPPSCEHYFPTTFLMSHDKSMRSLPCYKNSLNFSILVGQKLSYELQIKPFHLQTWEGKDIDQVGLRVLWDETVHEQDARRFKFLYLVSLFYSPHSSLQKFLRPIWILWSMIDYLWKELKLYLPSIEIKASYIMEL
jgi:hypothetical protein